MNQPTFNISLRFSGDDLIPDDISECLDCKPTEAFFRGEEVKSGKFVRIQRTGVWLLTESSDGTFDERVLILLERCTNSIERWQLLTSRFNPDLFVGVFASSVQSAFSISEETLSRLSARGIGMSLDLYCNL